jgi:hypothetical protein
VFELGREAKKSLGGSRLLKKTCVSGDCRDDAAGGVLKSSPTPFGVTNTEPRWH